MISGLQNMTYGSRHAYGTIPKARARALVSALASPLSARRGAGGAASRACVHTQEGYYFFLFLQYLLITVSRVAFIAWMLWSDPRATRGEAVLVLTIITAS